jgi:hypothetical protein
MIRKIAVSLMIILFVYAISNYPGNRRWMQRVIPPIHDFSGQKWSQQKRVQVHTNYLLCGHRDLMVYNHQNQYFIETVISHAQQANYKISHQGRTMIYCISKKDWCPSCKSCQFLSILDQNVVVRYGTPGKPGPIRETLHINIDRLPKSEREDLRKGIRFRDNKEKLQIIEGLSEILGEL